MSILFIQFVLKGAGGCPPRLWVSLHEQFRCIMLVAGDGLRAWSEAGETDKDMMESQVAYRRGITCCNLLINALSRAKLPQ